VALIRITSNDGEESATLEPFGFVYSFSYLFCELL
jgi:hypothetical protein